MVTSPHTPQQRADMQAERNVHLATAAAMAAVRQDAAAAEAYDRARELQLTVGRETPATPLT
jgi:hypothetical protein